jgi:hypothetical protein
MRVIWIFRNAKNCLNRPKISEIWIGNDHVFIDLYIICIYILDMKAYQKTLNTRIHIHHSTNMYG